jgi:hypothetical protein
MIDRMWKRFAWGMLLAGLVFWGVSYSLSSRHICWKEGRRLSDREVVDRYLFGADAPLMTEGQKIAAAEKKGYVYPNCCAPIGTIGGTYDLRDYTFSLEKDGRRPYTEEDVDTDSCGQVNKVLTLEASKKDYDEALDANRKFWEEQQ